MVGTRAPLDSASSVMPLRSWVWPSSYESVRVVFSDGTIGAAA
ncbi:MAG: hypothetical protein V4718_04175 [Pseudomonadota bacterium]